MANSENQKLPPKDLIRQKMAEMPTTSTTAIAGAGSPKLDQPKSAKKGGGISFISIIAIVLAVGSLVFAGYVFMTVSNEIKKISASPQEAPDTSVQDEKINTLETRMNELETEAVSSIESLESQISGTEGFASQATVTSIERVLKVTDKDGDGIDDYEEVITYKTNPNDKDTDNDGFTDKAEIDRGYNPNGTGLLEEKPEEQATVEEENIIRIVASDFKFEPNQVEADAGKLLRLELSSVEGNHSFTIDELNVDVDLKPGTEEVVEISSPKAGEYKYYSKNSTDVENKMEGILTVK
jgi:plastocyanin